MRFLSTLVHNHRLVESCRVRFTFGRLPANGLKIVSHKWNEYDMSSRAGNQEVMILPMVFEQGVVSLRAGGGPQVCNYVHAADHLWSIPSSSYVEIIKGKALSWVK